MFKNLRAEMARKGLTGEKVGAGIGITGKTFSNKMVGKNEFTRQEMFMIRNLFFKGLTLEYLFESEEEKTA